MCGRHLPPLTTTIATAATTITITITSHHIISIVNRHWLIGTDHRMQSHNNADNLSCQHRSKTTHDIHLHSIATAHKDSHHQHHRRWYHLHPRPPFRRPTSDPHVRPHSIHQHAARTGPKPRHNRHDHDRVGWYLLPLITATLHSHPRPPPGPADHPATKCRPITYRYR